MTAEQRLTTLNATLADATKACPGCPDCPPRVDDLQVTTDTEGRPLGLVTRQFTEWVTDSDEPLDEMEARSCQGKGEVAMFAGFRQMCRRAGGLEDALAGLTYAEYHKVTVQFHTWLAKGDRYWGLRTDPMPDANTILVKALELVCEVKRLGVSDA